MCPGRMAVTVEVVAVSGTVSFRALSCRMYLSTYAICIYFWHSAGEAGLARGCYVTTHESFGALCRDRIPTTSSLISVFGCNMLVLAPGAQTSSGVLKSIHSITTKCLNLRVL